MITKSKSVLIIVAHPDDETLWAGGTILSHPEWDCFIICLCRKNDEDRAPKFAKVLHTLGSHGIMGDLDDGPDQIPLLENEVEEAIIELLPAKHFDLILTHSIYGEYTKHLRHSEIGKAVIFLWSKGKINAEEVWAFAYEDNNRTHFPLTIEEAPLFFSLPPEIWKTKYCLITEVYGFNKESWEAQTTPKEEAFWQFTNPEKAMLFLESSKIKT